MLLNAQGSGIMIVPDKKFTDEKIKPAMFASALSFFWLDQVLVSIVVF